jgi:hypothetical protein
LSLPSSRMRIFIGSAKCACDYLPALNCSAGPARFGQDADTLWAGAVTCLLAAYRQIHKEGVKNATKIRKNKADKMCARLQRLILPGWWSHAAPSRVDGATRSAVCFSLLVFLVALSVRAQIAGTEQKTMTLEELQQMVLQNNPTFAQSAADIQAAEGMKRQETLLLGPALP